MQKTHISDLKQNTEILKTQYYILNIKELIETNYVLGALLRKSIQLTSYSLPAHFIVREAIVLIQKSICRRRKKIKAKKLTMRVLLILSESTQLIPSLGKVWTIRTLRIK